MITKFSQVFLFRRAALEDILAQFPLLAPRPLPVKGLTLLEGLTLGGQQKRTEREGSECN